MVGTGRYLVMLVSPPHSPNCKVWHRTWRGTSTQSENPHRSAPQKPEIHNDPHRKSQKSAPIRTKARYPHQSCRRKIVVSKTVFAIIRSRSLTRKFSSTNLYLQNFISKTTQIFVQILTHDMQAPKGSKARRIARRRAVCSTLDRLYATLCHRPGGSGDRTVPCEWWQDRGDRTGGGVRRGGGGG